jgi:hypothetical protein
VLQTLTQKVACIEEAVKRVAALFATDVTDTTTGSVDAPVAVSQLARVAERIATHNETLRERELELGTLRRRLAAYDHIVAKETRRTQPFGSPGSRCLS